MVCGFVAGAGGVAVFKAAPEPDPKNALALATGEAPSSTRSIPPAITKSYSEREEFAQKAPDAGAIAAPLRPSRPRSMQAINERPPIAAVPIGHTDRTTVLSSDPAIQLTATVEVPPGSSTPTGAAAAVEPSIASAVPEAPARVASVQKKRTHRGQVAGDTFAANIPARQIIAIIIINHIIKATTGADTFEFGEPAAGTTPTHLKEE